MPTLAPIPAPESLSPAPDRKRRQHSTQEYVTAMDGMVVLGGTNHASFLRTVEQAGVRTRQLPGEKRPKFNREDLERVARESVHVGLPKQSVPA